jgi:hypothetical protein
MLSLIAANPRKEDTHSSSEIESKIGELESLDYTLEDLSERLSPRALINDVLNWVESCGVPQTGSESFDSLKRGYRNVVRQAKENPIHRMRVCGRLNSVTSV